MIQILLAIIFTTSNASAQELLRLESIYSRGNDDLVETNHETAKIKIALVISHAGTNAYSVKLQYSGTFSVDHPHNPAAENYWLKQLYNRIEPDLTVAPFTYESGPDGTSLGGKVRGEIFLGELRSPADGPWRGRLSVTLMPYYEPNDPRPIDSFIDWGFMIKQGKPALGNVSMTAQWKGEGRPSEEMLRLISSSFVDASQWRPPFPNKS